MKPLSQTPLRFALLASLAFSLSACGKVVPLDGDGGLTTDGRDGDGGNVVDGGVGGPCEAPIAFEDLQECLAAAQCEQFVRCTPFFKDLDECKEHLATMSDFARQVTIFGYAIDAGKISYDPNEAATCLEGFATASCDSEGPEQGCDLVFRGEQVPGGTCLDDFECAELGSRCSIDSCPGGVECCLGSCSSPVGIGENCNSDRCLPGDVCVRNLAMGNDFFCQSGNQGSPCSDSFECDDDQYCDLTLNLCAPDKPAGATCGDRQECAGDQDCVFGSCGSIDTVGAPCEFSCLGSLTCDSGLCEPLPGLGELCPTGQCNSFLLDCVGPGTTQACVNKAGLGDNCGQRQCSPGLVCEAELPQPPPVPKCIEPLENGAECFTSSTCQSNHCAFNQQTKQSFCADILDCYSEVPF